VDEVEFEEERADKAAWKACEIFSTSEGGCGDEGTFSLTAEDRNKANRKRETRLGFDGDFKGVADSSTFQVDCLLAFLIVVLFSQSAPSRLVRFLCLGPCSLLLLLQVQ